MICIYSTLSIQLAFLISSSMIEAALKGLSLASEAARTNFFGLGCPLYCVQPSPSLLALIFLLGFGSGAFLASYIAWTFLFRPPSSGPSPVVFAPSSRYSALSEYLNEPSFHSRRRPN